MEFYYEKFRNIRKLKKIKIEKLAKDIEVSRTTLWFWETGKVKPSEKKILYLARLLNISVNEISDLQDTLQTSEKGIEQYESIFSEWTAYSDIELTDKARQQEHFLNKIKDQIGEGLLAISIFRKLLNFSDIMLYMKDITQKYISASKKFIDLVSMGGEQSVIGKTDKNLFPYQEAKENEEEDMKVIQTGNVVKNREGVIPGSRKQRWGLISKLPIFDASGKISGIIGSFVDITERKKNELLIEQLKKGLEMMDAVIWMAKGAKDTPGGIRFEKPLFALKSKLLKEIFNIDGDITPDAKMQEYAGSLILDNDKREKIKLADLKKNKKAEIRFKSKTYDNRIYNIHSKMYYDPVAELYVGMLRKDTETERIEKVIEKLRKCGVKENIIKEVFKE